MSPLQLKTRSLPPLGNALNAPPLSPSSHQFEKSAQQASAPLESESAAPTSEHQIAEPSAQIASSQKFNRRQMGSLVCAISSITLGTALLFVAHYASFSQTTGHILFPLGILCQGIGAREVIGLALRTKRQLKDDDHYLEELHIQSIAKETLKVRDEGQGSGRQPTSLQLELVKSRAQCRALQSKLQRQERLNLAQRAALSQNSEMSDRLQLSDSKPLRSLPSERVSPSESSQSELRPLLGTLEARQLDRSRDSVTDPKFESTLAHEIGPLTKAGALRPIRSRPQAARPSEKSPVCEIAPCPEPALPTTSAPAPRFSREWLEESDRQLLENL